jgi:hypothetical protein
VSLLEAQDDTDKMMDRDLGLRPLRREGAQA